MDLNAVSWSKNQKSKAKNAMEASLNDTQQSIQELKHVMPQAQQDLFKWKRKDVAIFPDTVGVKN